MSFNKANNKYNASLTTDYTAGDSTLGVNSVPTNFPTIITVARNTSKETRFYVTGGGSGLLTGVTRLDGANENISSGVSVECMVDAEFINQLESAVFIQSGLKQLIYAADGGSTDAYVITLPVVPSSLTDVLGLPLSFKANTINTGSATLDINGLGVKTIKKNVTENLADGDIQAGQIVTVIYDGTNFQMQGKIVDLSTINKDGWLGVTDIWTYASANTITVPSGAASLYQIGDRIKWTQTTVKYGVIIAVADTLLTIAINTDYVVSNAAILNISYSHQLNPLGYPSFFNWVPSLSWGGTPPTTPITSIAKFSLIDRSIHLFVSYIYTNSGSAVTDVHFPPPIISTVGGVGLYNQPLLGYHTVTGQATVPTG